MTRPTPPDRRPESGPRPSEAADLRARLARLERSQRRGRVGLALAGVLAVCLAAAAPGEAADEPVDDPADASADATADVLRCKRLEVVDDAGALIAAIGTDEDGSTGLFVHDEAGRVRLAAIHDATQTGLLALDTAGTVRMGVVQFAHGGGGLALHGEESVGASVLYHDGEQGELTFYDAEGEVRAHFPETR